MKEPAVQHLQTLLNTQLPNPDKPLKLKIKTNKTTATIK